jgi:putative Mn2+ efflux pump MntP
VKSVSWLSVSVWIPAIVIGLVAAGMSGIGIAFGGWLGYRWGRVAQAVGSSVLLVIAIRLLVSHLTS